MTDRSRDLGNIRAIRRCLARSKHRHRGRLARRPSIEVLERRALLSTAGSPDFTYAPTNLSSSGGPNDDTRGLSIVEFQPPGGPNNISSLVTGETIQSDGKVDVVGSVIKSGTSSGVVEVTRLNTDGSVDTTFGISGVVALTPTTLVERATPWRSK